MIYFLLAEELKRIKIGYTDKPDVYRRIKGLQNFSPSTLKLLGTSEGSADEELALQNRFKNLRVYGEWFDFKDELKQFVDEQVQKFDQPHLLHSVVTKEKCVGCNTLTKRRYNIFAFGSPLELPMCKKCFQRTHIQIEKEKRSAIMAKARLNRWKKKDSTMSSPNN